MAQSSFFDLVAWTVSDLTRRVQQLIEGDPGLRNIWVQGEVSNLLRHTSGHVYFTLKDASSSVKCVMWRSQAARQAYLPQNGEAVQVHGYVGVYPVSGAYQLYADQILAAGEGQLFLQFLRLKERLEAEGLFSEERKRPIPRWPQCIGIVTSPTGAALRDMVKTIRRRYPLARVVLSPAQVQGDEAPASIVAALQALNRDVQPDVILVARGGGSIEDLWAFNDEGVARAIAASAAPVISGVGHETDFTIADFVSDLRAPTPTGAAELATPDRSQLRPALGELQLRLLRTGNAAVQQRRGDLLHLERRLLLRSPQALILAGRQHLDELERRAMYSLASHVHLQRARLGGLEISLAALSPLAVLQRGYAIVTKKDGRLVRSVAQLLPGDEILVRLPDGSFAAQVSLLRSTLDDQEH